MLQAAVTQVLSTVFVDICLPASCRDQADMLAGEIAGITSRDTCYSLYSIPGHVSYKTRKVKRNHFISTNVLHQSVFLTYYENSKKVVNLLSEN